MITIEEEINNIINFLSYNVGYTISINGDLTLNPVYGTIDHWEVAWSQQEDHIVYDYQKVFASLDEAVQFFVEKRRYMCLGVDFVELYNSPEEKYDGVK